MVSERGADMIESFSDKTKGASEYIQQKNSEAYIAATGAAAAGLSTMSNLAKQTSDKLDETGFTDRASQAASSAKQMGGAALSSGYAMGAAGASMLNEKID